MKNAVKTAVFIAALAAAIIAVTACNKGKSEAQAAENAVQQETAVQEKEEASVTAQGVSASTASRLNGSWLMIHPDLDGYYKLNNGGYESYNSLGSDLITTKGTYTLNGDIITFTQTHHYGGPFGLHNDVLYTKDEVKVRYETSVEVSDEVFEDFFPGTFGSFQAKYVQGANPDYDMFISESGRTYKRILASGKTAAAAPLPASQADFTINGRVLEKYNGNERFVIIPEGITEIGIRAFAENKNITNVVIPDGVSAISAGAFLRCTSLASVNIPLGVTLIGSGAFYECTSLTRLTIPESVTRIDEFAFQKSTGIKRLEIPEGVTWIGNYVFKGWTSAQTIIIRGKGGEAGADAAWGPAQNGEYWWRGDCGANFIYMS